MTRVDLPRYFVSRTDIEPVATLAEEFIPLHALDNFFAGGRHLQEQEWIVAMDTSGVLRALSGDDIGDLAGDIQSQIAFSEMASEGKLRLVETTEFFLFNIQLMEQSTGAPGLNDPIYLYGTLHGPYPQSAGKQALSVEGQLTVTRADLLDALVQGAKYRFRATGGGADVGTTTAVYHMVLPGGRNEEIIRGAGYIFAYPLLPPDMMTYGCSNEVVVSQYLFDILSGLRNDLEEENLKLPLRKMRLPVPNRLALEQDLEAQGYIIKGDTAIRKPSATGGVKGLVQSVFGSGKEEKLNLPEEGSLEDFIALAEQVVNSIPGWPPERTRLMRGKILTASTEVHMRAKGTAALKPREIHLPRATDTGRSTGSTRGGGTGTSTTGGAASRQRPAGWMQDFIDKHQSDDNKGWTKLTGPENIATGANSPAGKHISATTHTRDGGGNLRPSWMSDFEGDGSTPTPPPKTLPAPLKEDTKQSRSRDQSKYPSKSEQDRKPARPEDSQARKETGPDWMKDFE